MQNGLVNLDDERIRIALGALLHDIGKVVQRAQTDPKAMTHQEFGHKYILENFGEIGKELAGFAKYHHFTSREKDELDVRSRYKSDLRLVAVADNYSAGEREYKREKKLEFDMYSPLKSVFSILKGAQKTYYFRVQKLSEGPNFPVENCEIKPWDYENLLNGFTEAIRKSNFHPNIVLNLIEEYFSFVPSHTIVRENISTDISLFDHSKTTCAIALALYNYLSESTGKNRLVDVEFQKIEDSTENAFALLLVDVSGIQQFIYTVGSRGSLKTLRARSFYIEMLLNFVAKKLLKELNLFESNVIFLGGGNLTILIQNTEGAKKKIEELLEKVNKELWREHKGRLWLNYALEELNGEVLLCKGSRSISDVISQLHEKLNEKKFKKFSILDPKDVFMPVESSGIYECEVCGEDIRREEFEGSRRCKVCNTLTDLGKYVHRAKYIAYNPRTPGKFYFEFNLFGNEKLCLSDEPIESEFIWVINPEAEQLLSGTPLYCGSYPGISRVFKREESPETEENTNEGLSKELRVSEDLEFHYVGSELIAALKMDVDYLGCLFSRGLPESSVSLSRLSNLSRFMNLFFKHYVNRIASGSVCEQFSIVHNSKNYPRELVIVYAGGDDLFVVGAWHDVIEFSFDVRKMFKKFIGDGIPITLSGGISINHPKFPVQVLAENADEEEKKSKSQLGKDSLTIWSRTMKWQEWEEVVEKFMRPLVRDFYETPKFDTKEIRVEEKQKGREEQKSVKITFVKEGEASLTPKKFNGKELSRRFVYKLLEISKIAEKLEKEGKFSLKTYSALAYLFGRNESIVKDKKYLLELLDVNKKDLLVKIRPALMWLDYLIR